MSESQLGSLAEVAVTRKEVLLFREVERLAGLSGIMLRGGCFCNPGACARHLGLTSLDIQVGAAASYCHACSLLRDAVLRHEITPGFKLCGHGMDAKYGDYSDYSLPLP